MKQNRSLFVALGCLMTVLGVISILAVGGVGAYMLTTTINQSNPNPEAVVAQVEAGDSSLPQPILNVTPPPAATAPPADVLPREPGTVAQAVEKALPAVVTVLSQGVQGSGSGSGFFINAEGYIVTNNHVVEGASALRVIYAQGGVAEARLIGTAPEFDLAVIKVDDLVPATVPWGDSSALPLGGDVVAIGSALGEYQNTVTAGVLSGFNRELGGLRGLLQTDAAINHGNSGGPLINVAGEVIGINTMIVRGGLSDAEGLGFAIPSNIARNVVRNLIESGSANQPFLGIQYQEVNPQLVLEANLSVNQGALVQEVVRGTPASQAGLQAGDVIVAVNGQTVDARHPLVSLLMEHVAGETVTFDIFRNGQVEQLSITLGQRS